MLVERTEWSGRVAECAFSEVCAKRWASEKLFPPPWNVTEDERQALSDTLERNGGARARSAPGGLALQTVDGGTSLVSERM